MQNSLWLLSVNDLEQLTSQAGHSFEIYLRKDVQNIHGLAINLSRVNSNDTAYIKSRLEAYNDVSDDSFYTIIDMRQEVFYSTATKKLCTPLPPNRRDTYKTFSGSGIEEPYISEVNGDLNIASYECFTFLDGARGIVRRSVPVSRIVSEFSLSLYDGKGFCYIVNSDGAILLRSNHEDSAQNHLNLFDAMNVESGDESDNQSAIASFRTAMSEGQSGVLRFSATDGKKYIYAYEPISGTNGWYYIAVVPDNVLLEQSVHILNISQLFVFVIAVGVLILIIVIILMRRNRRVMEKIVREVQYREQVFDILTNSTGDAFVMYTEKDELVEYVSPNIEQMTGIPAEKVRENIAVLRDGGTPDPAFRQELARLETGASFCTEQQRIHQKTGGRRWFTITAYRVVIDRIDKVIMVFSDRTMEKQKEQALKEAMNVAETANRAKSTFLNNMSHDIRTPMNAIVGLCTLLQRDADNSERVRDYTKKITTSSQHLLGLINDVLDMSKIEAGKTTLNISTINIAKIVEGLNTILMPQAKAKDQSFEISVFDMKSEHLLGDELRINQIMMNILSNAIKYTPEGGRIEMVIRQLPQATKNFARIRFIITDNGIGMSPEYLDTIFQPFTREINSNTNKIQGTGLGMTITKRLVDLMGGVITVESAPGQGTTFTVDLELRLQEQHVHQDFWEKHGVTKVLVVDDEEEICTNVIRIMEGTGVSMQYALSGLSAIHMIEQEEKLFDLVLLDWKMPDMDGIETARRIRSILPKDTPILILTAYDWSDIEEEAREAGIDGFMPKPFFLSNFELTIERLHEKETDITQDNDGALKGLHILAAEDNPLNAEILLKLLNMLGASCDLDENGEKVVEHFSQSQPEEYDLILMDVQMPVMNGYDATRAIRTCEHPRAKSIPIVAMTADAFAEDIQHARKAGMNAHMAKPINLKALEEIVMDLKRDGSIKK